MQNERISSTIKILLLEDQSTTQKILAEVIASEQNFELLAVCDTVADGLRWLESSEPDVLLVDLKLKDGLGIDVIRACANRHPNCSIMVLTVSLDESDVNACIQAGALGYLVKEDGLLGVGKAIRDLVLGGSPISPFVMRRLLFESAKKYPRTVNADAADGKKIEFTKRELAVLSLIAQGLTYEETAKRLCISVLTVQNYIKRLYRKLSVNSRGQAVFEAQRRGFLN
ncbi:response regulator transcription factor [Oxalobacteraceae bacterium R-40]|uniref:Response regulator transcription factor n=1 Tax=Keguizhuia sedimenti TaxID=3064264 RepID=A0ABU1BN48_9BURK|nr:response regulator transcription factor [Oxalobacteraceae bacterium R-40]